MYLTVAASKKPFSQHPLTASWHSCDHELDGMQETVSRFGMHFRRQNNQPLLSKKTEVFRTTKGLAELGNTGPAVLQVISSVTTP